MINVNRLNQALEMRFWQLFQYLVYKYEFFRSLIRLIYRLNKDYPALKKTVRETPWYAIVFAIGLLIGFLT